MPEDPTLPMEPALVCRGARLETTAAGIFGPMSLVCITCGVTVATWKPVQNDSARAWIADAWKDVLAHSQGKVRVKKKE